MLEGSTRVRRDRAILSDVDLDVAAGKVLEEVMSGGVEEAKGVHDEWYELHSFPLGCVSVLPDLLKASVAVVALGPGYPSADVSVAVEEVRSDDVYDDTVGLVAPLSERAWPTVV